MSPEQLKTLQRLSELFEAGLAGPEQIKQLSELLANINQHQESNESKLHQLLAQPTSVG